MPSVIANYELRMTHYDLKTASAITHPPESPKVFKFVIRH